MSNESEITNHKTTTENSSTLNEFNIPISRPFLTDSCRRNFINAFDSSWISSLGEYISKFEALFSKYIGTNYCLSTSNGTTALELAISALDLDERSEIIIPDLTFAAVSNAVLAKGHIPVCVDVSPVDWNITLKEIQKSLTKDTKAVIVVHSYGIPAIDLENISKFCKANNLWLIEDCAEAHGATFKSKKVGSFGDMATFSFYGNKIITSGEGGAVLTSNKILFERMFKLRDHGMSKERRYFHDINGFNYRITNPQASLLVSQLENINEFLELRKRQEFLYDKRLLDYKFTKAESIKEATKVNWIYTVQCPGNIQSSALAKYLKQRGIDTRPIFHPISTFPYIEKKCSNKVALLLSKNGLSLPTYIGLEDEMINKICDEIEGFISNNS